MTQSIILTGCLSVLWVVNAAPREGLVLNLSADASTATIGDDFQVDMSLENTGTKPADVDEFLFEERSVDFEVTFVTSLGAKRMFRDSIVRADPDVAKRLPLQRGSLAVGHSLRMSHRIPLFSKGPVTVVGVYHGTGGPLRSQPATVQVQPGPGGASRLSVKLETTKGDLRMLLLPEESPANVSHFIRLARDHYYSPMLFFQILKGDWIRTGCPYDNGCGAPGYTLRPEAPPPAGGKDSVIHDLGTVSLAANVATGNTGSQFIIELRRHPGFEGKYPIIGVLTPESVEVARKISEQDVEPGTQQPKLNISLERLTVAGGY